MPGVNEVILLEVESTPKDAAGRSSYLCTNPSSADAFGKSAGHHLQNAQLRNLLLALQKESLAQHHVNKHVCAVSFVTEPDFYGPKNKQNRPQLQAGQQTRGQQALQLQAELQEGPAHPQYAAWARMMTPPDENRQTLLMS